MAVKLEFGMMLVCSMLGVIGEEIALQRSSGRILFQFSALTFSCFALRLTRTTTIETEAPQHKFKGEYKSANIKENILKFYENL